MYLMHLCKMMVVKSHIDGRSPRAPISRWRQCEFDEEFDKVATLICPIHRPLISVSLSNPFYT